MEKFSYRAPNGTRGVCGLTILKGEDSRLIVMLTELKDNPGQSVTNAWPGLASSVYYRLLQDADPRKIVWIEHYNHKSYHNTHRLKGDLFDLVEVHWNETRHEYAQPKKKRMWQPAPDNLVCEIKRQLTNQSANSPEDSKRG